MHQGKEQAGDRHGAGTGAESLHLFFTHMRQTERAKLGMVCALETSAHDQKHILSNKITPSNPSQTIHQLTTKHSNI